MTRTRHRLYQPQELTLVLMGTHSSNIWELNRTLKASIPSMTNYCCLGIASYNTEAHLNTPSSIAPNAPSSIAPITPSHSICPRCKDGHNPNC